MDDVSSAPSPVHRVDEVLQQRDDLTGRVVTVEGFLVAPATGVYLLQDDVPEHEAVDGREQTLPRLVLPDGAVVDRLLAVVPPYLGGPYMYRDHAVVVGRLVGGAAGPALVAVGSLVVTRSGRSYAVA